MNEIVNKFLLAGDKEAVLMNHDLQLLDFMRMVLAKVI